MKKYYKCEDEYEDEQNGILGNIHIIKVSFLILTRGSIIIVKNYLRVILS